MADLPSGSMWSWEVWCDHLTGIWHWSVFAANQGHWSGTADSRDAAQAVAFQTIQEMKA